MIHHRTVLAIIGLVAAGSAHAESFKATAEETHPLDAHGEVRLANVNGSVSVRTWDRAEVRIEWEKHALSADDLKAIEVSIDATADTLTIETRYPSHPFSWLTWLWEHHEESVQYTLTVPAAVRLGKIDTVNASIRIEGIEGAVRASTVNGDVTISRVQGAVEASTVNGSIHASGLQNEASFSTVNGAIHAEFDALSSGGHLAFETVNGSISVALPRTAGATIAVSTVNGGVSCDFPVQIKSSGRNSLHGTIADGGTTIKATSVNGAIHLGSL